MKRKMVLCAGFAALGAAGWAAGDVHALVDEVYARLTPEERVAQICAATAGELCDATGRFDPAKARAKYPHGIGHVCQFACNRTDEPAALAQFVRDVQAFFIKESTAHIPAICHEEVISGLAARTATTYPQQIGIACTWDAPLLEQKCRETAEAMRAVGATFALSPMADVCYNSNWTRLEEGYGESGYLAAVMGTAFVRGLQSADTAACTKHFLGYGVIGGGHARPWRDVIEEVILPHEAMIKAGGAAAVMTSYDSFKGELAVTSPTLIQKLLRGYIGFDGTVVSDYGALGKGIAKGDEAAAKQCALDALLAGNDVDLPHGAFYQKLDGTEEGFEAAVKNALLLKARLGLLGGSQFIATEKGADAINCVPPVVDLDPPAWRTTARKLAEESIVLLKNDGILPLKPGTQIALVGPNANSAWAMLGDYTYQAMQAFWRRNPRDWDKPHIVTLKEGLERFGEVAYQRGCGWSNPGETGVSAGGDPRTEKLSLQLIDSADPTDFDAAVRAAAAADVVVCAMGENFTLCGENRQRASIRLAGDQEKLVKACIATGKPVVLVLFGGRNQVIADIADGCAAVLQCWYPGEEGGNAVADILLGRVNPSGKLAMTYPRTEDKADLTFGDGSDTPERVQWPFGYGLSYTTFAYSDFAVDGTTVSFTLSNTGSRDGAEVAQVYIKKKGGDRTRLRGFARVELKAGEKKRVTVEVPVESFARWEGEAEGEWVVDAGEYEIAVGASAWDIKATLAVSLPASRFPRRETFFATAKTEVIK